MAIYRWLSRARAALAQELARVQRRRQEAALAICRGRDARPYAGDAGREAALAAMAKKLADFQDGLLLQSLGLE